MFFIPGIDRSRVKSLFTPHVRFTEVVEDGITGGNVVPADFQATPDGLAQVRKNILKSDVIGRLVANDFSGAMISAQLLEINPETGEKLDYLAVAEQLEADIRQAYSKHLEATGQNLEIHIIGFAKLMGDLADGTSRVLIFFAISLILIIVLAAVYTQSLPRTSIVIFCSLIAVVWQFGLLAMLGYGIDPMSILVPFLVFAIGVSHGIQMVSANGEEIFSGWTPKQAAKRCFRRLCLPGSIALASDTLGFLIILLIEIPIIQEMAISASVGVAVIVLTNLFLLPLLLSYLRNDAAYRAKLQTRAQRIKPIWLLLAKTTRRVPALVLTVCAVGLAIVGFQQAAQIKIGDLDDGVPELREDARYNQDLREITQRFSIGVDMLSVFAESAPEGCIDHEIMRTIDQFSWHMLNQPGVQSTHSLPGLAKIINAGWNEGSLKWRVLPSNPQSLAQTVSFVPTTSGLLNSDCSVMPVLIFTSDHRATTIDQIIAAAQQFEPEADVQFHLASGNIGVMAATNDAVRAAQYPILFCIFAAVGLLCVISLRSVNATLCILLPLALVSLLGYALMAMLDIGLKVSTLPVVALGVGVGVDYGIYIYSRLHYFLKKGYSLENAYFRTLAITGNSVLFTALILSAGVATWIFSPLQFQADMGLLLTFLFFVNMVGAIILLPALARWLISVKI